MIFTSTPAAWRYFAVPRVAMMSKPSCESIRAGSEANSLSASLSEMNTVPDSGSLAPPPIWLLAKADRKSTRLNSSHVKISYAVFCLKKKKKNNNHSFTQKKKKKKKNTKNKKKKK